METVSSVKKAGGLALGGILDRNKALLGKRLWRYELEYQSLIGQQGSGASMGKLETVGEQEIKHSSHRSPWKGISQVLPIFLPFTNYLWDVVT